MNYPVKNEKKKEFERKRPKKDKIHHQSMSNSNQQHNQHQNHHQNQQQQQHPTQITIYNVPKEDLTIDKLNEYFKQFGKIVNILVKAEVNKAYIQFETAEEASAALTASEPVFGNRSIKIVPSRKFNAPISKDSEAVVVPISKKSFYEPKKFPPTPKPLFNNKIINETSSSSSSLSNNNLNTNNNVTIPTTFKLENKSKLSKNDLQNLEKEKQEKRKSQLEQTKMLLEKLGTMKNVDPTLKSELLLKIKNLSSTVSDSLSKDSNQLQKQKEEIEKKELF